MSNDGQFHTGDRRSCCSQRYETGSWQSCRSWITVLQSTENFSEILWLPLTLVESVTPAVLNLKLQTLSSHRKSKVSGPEGLPVLLSALYSNPLISQGLCALFCPPLSSIFFGGSPLIFHLVFPQYCSLLIPSIHTELNQLFWSLIVSSFSPQKKNALCFLILWW